MNLPEPQSVTFTSYLPKSKRGSILSSIKGQPPFKAVIVGLFHAVAAPGTSEGSATWRACSRQKACFPPGLLETEGSLGQG